MNRKQLERKALAKVPKQNKMRKGGDWKVQYPGHLVGKSGWQYGMLSELPDSVLQRWAGTNEEVERTVDALLELKMPSVDGFVGKPTYVNPQAATVEEPRDSGWWVLTPRGEVAGARENKPFNNFRQAAANPVSRRGAKIVWTDGHGKWWAYHPEEQGR